MIEADDNDNDVDDGRNFLYTHKRKQQQHSNTFAWHTLFILEGIGFRWLSLQYYIIFFHARSIATESHQSWATHTYPRTRTRARARITFDRIIHIHISFIDSIDWVIFFFLFFFFSSLIDWTMRNFQCLTRLLPSGEHTHLYSIINKWIDYNNKQSHNRCVESVQILYIIALFSVCVCSAFTCSPLYLIHVLSFRLHPFLFSFFNACGRENRRVFISIYWWSGVRVCVAAFHSRF